MADPALTCTSTGTDDNAGMDSSENHNQSKVEQSDDNGFLSTMAQDRGPGIVSSENVEKFEVTGEIASDTDVQFQNSGWGTATSWENTNSWGMTDADEPIVDSWASPDNHFLMKLLGPTLLPSSHETGVVEWSLRRIKAVYPPLGSTCKVSSTKEDQSYARDSIRSPHPTKKALVGENQLLNWLESGMFTGVEEDILQKFGRMVLEPWLDWDTGHESDISEPRILPSSRFIPTDNQRPHDPLTQDIAVLVTPEVVASGILSVGMGLGATWVQIARQRGREPSSANLVGNGHFWYMEQLMSIFPSYYLQPTQMTH
jgi:hypothetical protein